MAYTIYDHTPEYVVFASSPNHEAVIQHSHRGSQNLTYRILVNQPRDSST